MSGPLGDGRHRRRWRWWGPECRRTDNDEAGAGDGHESMVDHADGADSIATHRRTADTATDPGRLLRRSARRTERVPTAGGSTLHLLVLASTLEDTTVVDLATRTVMRVRCPGPRDTSLTSAPSTWWR